MHNRGFLKITLLAFAVLLSACSPTIMERGEALSDPALQSNTVKVADGALLPLRHWAPTAEATGVILALHGFNDYSNAFAAPAEEWRDAGLHVYAYDQRGFGKAPHWRYWAGTPAMVDDVIEVAQLLRQRHPTLPLTVLGESMGGAVVMVASTKGLDADRLVLVAPAVWGRETMPWWQSGTLDFVAHTMPWLELTGRGLNKQPSDNIEMLRALGRDPLIIKRTRTDAIWGLVNLMDEARAAAPAFNRQQSALFLYGAKEDIIPPDTWRSMITTLPGGAEWQLIIYDQGYHMLLRDLSADRVIEDIIEFTQGKRKTDADALKKDSNNG